MHSTTYTQARQNLKTYLDKICSDNIPLRVERREGENVVIISETDYDSLEETAYLLRSPKNAKRLLEAIGRKKRMKVTNVTSLANEVGIGH